jgi:predicted DNA-binding transcriptional regulator AlpA
MKSPEKLLIDIHELSELTGIAVGTLYHWATESRLPCVRLSPRCLRFRPAEVEAWLVSLSTPVGEQLNLTSLSGHEVRHKPKRSDCKDDK